MILMSCLICTGAYSYLSFYLILLTDSCHISPQGHIMIPSTSSMLSQRVSHGHGSSIPYPVPSSKSPSLRRRIPRPLPRSSDRWNISPLIWCSGTQISSWCPCGCMFRHWKEGYRAKDVQFHDLIITSKQIKQKAIWYGRKKTSCGYTPQHMPHGGMMHLSINIHALLYYLHSYWITQYQNLLRVLLLLLLLLLL